MKLLRSFLVMVFLSFAVHAPAATLFDRADAGWRWRPGMTEASTPVSAWRANGFDDGEFVTAPAPFWYGDVLPGGTQIVGMQNVYLCIFLRKTFVITNTAEIAALRLGSMVDDGFTAWINGAEVLRVNMIEAALSPVTITNLAVNAVEPPPFNFNILANPSSYLVLGTNVLAVQVLQSSLASSDLGFDASLESILNETTPPTILNVTPSAGSTVSGLSAITVTFSEPVNGVDALDFRINGTAAIAVTPLSSSIYSFNFTQPDYGSVQITWDVGHGITDQAVTPNPFNATGPGATWQYTLQDQTAPTLATLSPAPGQAVRSLTNITVVFSENVTGVDAADLRINATPATLLSGGGNVYTFGFPQPTTGLVQVAWAPAHGITDLAAAPNAFVAGGNWLYTLDPNAPQGTGPVISEFMALNIDTSSELRDEDGETSDWIEIQNVGNNSANLLDWSLTDEAGNPTKWRFPATNMPGGGFLVVFASGKNRRIPGAWLHTNFKLRGGSEYLALHRPDGSIASEFAPFPPQSPGVSYGLGVLSTNSTLVSTNSPVRVRVPANGNDGTNWLYPGFNDSAWTAGTNGVGYGTTNVTQADYSAAVLPTGPLTYWRLNEAGGTTAANIGSAEGLNGTYTGAALGTSGPRPPQFGGFEPNNNAPTFAPASSSYIGIPSPLMNNLPNRSIFTMAGWIKPAAPQAARTGLFGQNDCVEFGFISATGLQLWTFVGQIDFAYPFAFGEWHHIAAVGTGSQLQLYLDGTLRASAALGAIPASGDNFNIGGGGIFDTISVNGNYFNGQIDEVAVWSRALNATELSGLYSAGTNPVGVAAVKFVKTDIGAAMSNVNATAYLRLPFLIENPSDVQLLTLRVRYDDGFVAYLNGIEVARANAPGALAYNSAATNTHSAASVAQFQLGAAVLTPGANVLAIQGLNAAAGDEDFLISAELTATHVAAASSSGVYMTGPTPGAANGAGVSVLGPVITDVTHSPNVPSDAQDLVVTARVTPTFATLTSVKVRYRIMFNAEIELDMLDDGLHGDGAAGDGVYGQTLPVANTTTNGQMIRWYFRATDGLGNVGRWPLFLSAVDEEYLGTVVDPTYVTSQLPIFHLFIAQAEIPKVDTESGGRLTIFYDGELYDNVYMELRGNTSAGLAKKAHRLEFNRVHEFRHPGPGGRVLKSSLLAEYIDPAYLRQHLCFWFLDKIGVPSPFDYPVRVQTNGAFYQLAFHNDVIGQEQIERMGYDPKGALYKAIGNADVDYSSTGVYQKLEPDDVVSRADYDQLARGINDTNTFANRRATVFDHLDVPEVISYLIGARWCSENDDVWANMSIYRDTFGDQLWRCIPFDMNASWGQRYGGVATLEATVDNQKSHPLYGGRAIHPLEAGPGDYYNRIYDVIISVPETREMFLRRMRSVMDRWIQPPGTPANSLIIENYIKSMTNLMVVEANLDRAKWGPSPWGPAEPFMGACSNVMVNFVGARRQHWYGTHCITNSARPTGTNSTDKAGIPLGQPLFSFISISNIEFNPSSGNQNQEYIQLSNPNNYAVDITDWKLDGAVQFTFKPGTVIPSNSVMYVSPNVVAFKQRTTSPRGGQGNFVVGPYDGQLNARGETLYLFNQNSQLVVSNSYPGAPSPAQLYLRITEIMYNPAPLAGNTNDAQEFEYLEMRNISDSVTLNLNGVHLTNGVEFNFTGSAITTLAPGASVLVVKNLAAFTARYGALPNVAGQYTGQLDSSGETLRLDDASGEKVLEFAFNNSWYPITDGHGFSLVIVDANASWDTWGLKESWRASGALYGSPGNPDPTAPDFAPIVVNEILTHTDPPLRDTVELFNPTTNDVNLSGWFITDDFPTPKKYRITNGCVIAAGGYLVFDETLLTNAATALIPFAFRGNGDEVWLFSGDANTNLTGYVSGENFGAAENAVSFGRYTNSVGKIHFVAQNANTLGGPNTSPRVGPVVVSEIMYHPPDLADGTDDSLNEFLELKNLTGAGVPFFDPTHPTNTWRVGGGASFTFPPGLTLAANASLLLVNFDPMDAAQVAAFRAKYGVPPLVPVLGPYSGKLNNDGDNVRLERPAEPDTNGLAYILVDRVEYEDGNDWPVAADGSGASLQRLNIAAYGNDPANWTAAAPTASSGLPAGPPPVITTQPASQVAFAGFSATFSVTATGAPLRYQWRFNGTGIPAATNSMFTLDDILVSDGGAYSVVVYNNSGSVISSNATLSVVFPATILTQPQPVSLRGSSNSVDYGNTTNNATFNVLAVGTGPVSYQWRFNGAAIPGATGTTLTITNVQLTNDGNYDVLVHDDIGTIPSTTARLTVLITPTFVQVPLAQAVPAGSRLNLSAIIQGNPPPFGYQWRSNSVVAPLIVSDSRTNFFSIRTATNAVVATYRLVVTNAASTGNGVFAQFNITTVADTDLDGLPDSVEISLGLDPNDPADGATDLDEDGASNRDEYIAGTNPNDKNSYLRIDPNPVPGMASVKFTALTNRTYSIQYTDQLPANGPWTKLADFVARTTNRVETVIDPGWTTNRFYRVALPAQ